MNTNALQRELKAILSADVKGYSKLMGDDDVRTVHTITKYRQIITERFTMLSETLDSKIRSCVLASLSSLINV
jgi:adenylate cyclase